MKIKYVTCSGADENTRIPNLLKLMEDYPVGEIGIQVSADKASKEMPRYDWILKLAENIQNSQSDIRAALHVNKEWVQEFCDGFVAPELDRYMGLRKSDGTPVFARVQLNIFVGREKTPNVDKVIETLNLFPKHRFIFSYNVPNASFIKELYDKGVVFDNLYDFSFGEGHEPESRGPVVFPDRLQGYAGGLSPDNIYEELDKISKVVPKDAEIYIDAQGHLADNKIFSISKARKFITNTLKWQKEHI